MVDFNKVFQSEHNGPLTPATRKRIHKVRDTLGYSWQDMGDAFEFSNTFVHGISRDVDPQRIRSKHIEGLIQNLEGLEVKAGILKVGNRSVPPPAASASDLSLEDLLAAITAKGFTVTLGPKA